MNQLMQKLSGMKNKLAHEKGPFWLFAFVLPKSSETGWDLIIAAPWLDSGIEGLKYVTDLLKSSLTDKEIRQIARVIILDQYSATLRRALREMPRKDEVQEMDDADFFGLPAKHAYVISVGEAENEAEKSLVTPR